MITMKGRDKETVQMEDKEITVRYKTQRENKEIQ